jgi:ATP-dependent HslUV protease subunit HslV
MKPHGTTILLVKRANQYAVASDGRIVYGEEILSDDNTKIRKIFKKSVIIGAAGEVSDADMLMEQIEAAILEEKDMIQGLRAVRDACVSTKKKNSDCQILVCDRENSFIVWGNGSYTEVTEDVVAIGSGAKYAKPVATVLLMYTNLSAEKIAQISIEAANNISVFSGGKMTSLTLKK